MAISRIYNNMTVTLYLYKKAALTLSITTSKQTVRNMTENALINQAIQWTPLLSPIIFITSFSLISFSYTIFLHIMATVSTHAKIRNSGRDREMAKINLNTK
jgi:hypothetical protein